jgi:hypothetical protein
VDSATNLAHLKFKKIQKFKKGVLAKTFAKQPAFIFELEHFLATFEIQTWESTGLPARGYLAAFDRPSEVRVPFPPPSLLSPPPTSCLPFPTHFLAAMKQIAPSS